MANNIIQAVLDYRYVDTRSVWQYDYGQVLRIQGENLSKAVEVHFSLNEVGGDSITKIGVTTDGITEVQVPDELLENGGARFKYNIYAFVYIEDGTSGNTEYRIRIPVQTRPKPSDHVTPDNTDTDPFGDAVKAVNNAAERAETSERNAKASEDAAAESAKKVANSVTELDTATKEALKSIEDKKIEGVSSVEKQKESSVQSVTEHTDSEIQRMTQRADEIDTSLGESIAEATAKKSALDKSVSASTEAKKSLDVSAESGEKLKTGLDESIKKAEAAESATELAAAETNKATESANSANQVLEESTTLARELEDALNESINEVAKDATGLQLLAVIQKSSELLEEIAKVVSETAGKAGSLNGFGLHLLEDGSVSLTYTNPDTNILESSAIFPKNTTLLEIDKALGEINDHLKVIAIREGGQP